MPDTREYLARIKSYSDGSDPLQTQGETPGVLAELISGQPTERLAARPAPGKWSVVEILAHLAEDEVVTSWRYRQMLEHDGPQLGVFDQDRWAGFGQYLSWEPAEALTMFRLLREANLRLFGRLSPEEWQRHGQHPERGRTTIHSLMVHMAGHDRNHVEQIRRILGV